MSVINIRKPPIKTDQFDYQLPPELIAAQPLADRQSSRMLCVHRGKETIDHQRFSQIVDHLRSGDILVRNNTRVIFARFRGVRDATNGQVEVLFEYPCDPTGAPHPSDPYCFDNERVRRWLVMTKSGGKLRAGETISLPGGFSVRIIERRGWDGDIVEVSGDMDKFRDELSVSGVGDQYSRSAEIPLPPYIKRPGGQPRPKDAQVYQTVYAAEPGAIAAPTAGLHFTPEILKTIEARGVGIADITLHVGAGTFRPVKTQTVESHPMHSEWFSISDQAASVINATKKSGGRIVAVGTTSLRALESAVGTDGCIDAGEQWTKLFIYPPAEFQVVDALLTNFHLPRSSLLMLVAAFLSPGNDTGIDRVQAIYADAIREHYRFFSYGDCMLIE